MSANPEVAMSAHESRRSGKTEPKPIRVRGVVLNWPREAATAIYRHQAAELEHIPAWTIAILVEMDL